MTERTERDFLGEKKVPEPAYYGIQTMRAVENFPISGLRAHPEQIKAIAIIKQAAAETNMLLKELDPGIGRAIVQAAKEISGGQWHEHFVVDVFQAGGGTSFHMNANEVIANRAIEILGGSKGDYRLVHPNDHVNMAQSSNDVFPTTIRLASLALINKLLPELTALEKALKDKAIQFNGVIKSGRTHLRDAVPVRLGQEFDAYAVAVHRAAQRIQNATSSLEEIGLGGTAIGTGINTHPRYHVEVVKRLKQLTGWPLKRCPSLIEATQSMSVFAETSSAMKLLALELIRLANDLRLMSSGPNTGLNEINLPAMQPGSSIMPGKVNPVVAELLNMVAFQVIGNDAAIALACQAGQLELNVMTPVIAFNLLESLEITKNAVRIFRERCVTGISINEETCRRFAERSLGMATVLSRHAGYEATARIVRESQTTGRSVREIAVERGLISKQEASQIFDPFMVTGPGLKRRSNAK